MKKQLFGALLLIAALAFAGCGNQNQTKNNQNQPVEKVKENRMLIIVDPQIDFTTGSLATAKGPEAMERLAQAIDNGVLDNYTWVIITQDAHPPTTARLWRTAVCFRPTACRAPKA